MKLSTKGADFIKGWEGLRKIAYLCPAQVWTIGYGHTATVVPGMTISHDEANRLFEADVGVFERAVFRMVGAVPQYRFDALVSFSFNVGVSALRKSRLLKLLNDGDIPGAGNQFPRWNKVSGRANAGLTARRKQERLMFLGMPFDVRPVA